MVRTRSQSCLGPGGDCHCDKSSGSEHHETPCPGKGSRKRKPEDERDETTLKRRQLEDSVPACTTHQVEAIVDQPIRREQPDEDGQVIVNYPPTFSAGSFVYERSLTDCTSSVTSSDQEDQEDQERREEESEYYQCRRHVALLRDKNCYMTDSKKGICRESEEIIDLLLSLPAQHSYFRDPNFLEKWKHAPYRNKESVLHHITPELVPSAEERTDRGARKLQWLTESTNEAWSEIKPLIKHRPHPDYSVGFHRQIFTKRDRENMIPVSDRFIVGESSRIMATPLMYFPFLSCEVKGADALPCHADSLNAHSATLGVRAVVELFKAVNRLHEIDRWVLAFSVSHNHREVRIYGHYADFEEGDIRYYRHPIYMFDFMHHGVEEVFTTNRFIQNVYEKWAPCHLEMISSVIDELPSYVRLPPSPQMRYMYCRGLQRRRRAEIKSANKRVLRRTEADFGSAYGHHDSECE